MSRGSIPLRTYRLTPRKARVELDNGQVHFHLPSYFGRRRLSVPSTECGVSDLEAQHQSWVEQEEWVYPDGSGIPYFFTTGPLTSPKLAVLFRSRQRVPPLRLLAAAAPNIDLPFGCFSSRRGAAHVDGMLLRAVDSTSGTEARVNYGCERVLDIDGFLAAHRQMERDPQVIAGLEERWKRAVWRQRFSYGLLLAGISLAAIGFGEDSTNWFLFTPGLMAVALGLYLRWSRRSQFPT